MWITNRQQGKTSTIAKFIAALALASKPAAMLVCVYGETQRAGELVAASKRYHWMMTEEGRHPKWPSIGSAATTSGGSRWRCRPRQRPRGVRQAKEPRHMQVRLLG